MLVLSACGDRAGSNVDAGFSDDGGTVHTDGGVAGFPVCLELETQAIEGNGRIWHGDPTTQPAL